MKNNYRATICPKMKKNEQKKQLKPLDGAANV